MSDESLYPYFGEPPTRGPRPAIGEPALRGKRVILSTPEGFVYDMRAVSEQYVDSVGTSVVDIISEEEYFRWMFTDQSPTRQSFPVRLVWVD